MYSKVDFWAWIGIMCFAVSAAKLLFNLGAGVGMPLVPLAVVCTLIAVSLIALTLFLTYKDE